MPILQESRSGGDSLVRQEMKTVQNEAVGIALWMMRRGLAPEQDIGWPFERVFVRRDVMRFMLNSTRCMSAVGK